MSRLVLTRQAPSAVNQPQRRCPRCGKQVSRTANVCGRCGKSQRIRPHTVLLCLAAGLIIGMFAVASAGAIVPQAHRAERPTAQAASAQGPLAASFRTPEISATELWAAYSADPASADRDYRDRSLIVTGIVRSIDRDYGGDMVVRLGAGVGLDTVNATVATRDEPAMSGLGQGRLASLLCVGRGASLGAPILSGCSLR